ncbi:MAG: DNA helicase II [Pseudomonadota bacterium]|nr:DNA helicase II [Pseudomonadota bacterium]
METTSILENLNDNQKNAVCSESKNCLVIAGAGSGKTRVLIQRIFWLISSRKISPYSILAVTFTNKAASEIKKRLQANLRIKIENMWVGTFHGICYRILRKNYSKVGLPKNFQIIDADDQLRLIKRIIKESDIENDQIQPKQYVWYINKKKDESTRSSEVKPDDFVTKQYNLVYSLYEEYCRKVGLVDFGEILLKVVELLTKDKETFIYYKNLFKEILIDEFQDTNSIQYKLVKILSGNENSIFAVGDDDQSIYGWRGAIVENIKKLQKDLSDIKVYRLEQNYRSSGNILSAANNVILNNSSRMGKELWTEDSSGELIKFFSAFNDSEEAKFVVEKIEDLTKGDFKRSEVAILYRSNAQSRIFEEYFISKNIPYRIYGGLRFFERAEIKDVLAYLRLAFNTRDDNSFERIINTPTRGIGEKTKSSIREYAAKNNLPLYYAIEEMCEKKILTNRIVESLYGFMKVIEKIKDSFKIENLPEQILEVIEITKIKDMYSSDKNEQARSKIENIDELVTAADFFSDENQFDDIPIIESFLAHASLEAGEGQGSEWDDCVQLMTLHSSKGLEFPIVFLVGLEEGLFPSRLSLEEGNLEEERRLCYVGITRARKLLFMTYSQIRRQYGTEEYQMPSRFIGEIPTEVIEEIRPTKGESFFKSNLNGNNSILIGSRVMHKKFGEGTITSSEGNDNNARVQVSFDKVGNKWLILALANLEILK